MQRQLPLMDIPRIALGKSDVSSTTFTDNMKLPVHRWYRYSAGFSAEWVERVIADNAHLGEITALDPYVGSGTTLIACDQSGVASIGVEAHPFVGRIATAKLLYREDPDQFLRYAQKVVDKASTITPSVDHYPFLIAKCYSEKSLKALDQLRRSLESLNDDSSSATLSWLALVTILRVTSTAGTAPWQYVLPNKAKRTPISPFAAYSKMVSTMATDMASASSRGSGLARVVVGDARSLSGVADTSINMVITSPPYPNNYDYADATRLEMSFFGEIEGWGDLQKTVRQHLVRSCSQHMKERLELLDSFLEDPAVAPIKDDLATVTRGLQEVRLSHGGKKAYHLMVAAYFVDMAKQWAALRRVCASPSEVYFVIGDSAPYGVYVPVMDWNSILSEHSGFHNPRFEKTRDRNIKWKNRKHRVPLAEGRFLVSG